MLHKAFNYYCFLDEIKLRDRISQYSRLRTIKKRTHTHTQRCNYITVTGAEKQEANMPEIRVLYNSNGTQRNSFLLLTKFTVS